MWSPPRIRRVPLAIAILISLPVFFVLHQGSHSLSPFYQFRPAPKFRDGTRGSWVLAPERAVEADTWHQPGWCRPYSLPPNGERDHHDEEKNMQRARLVASWEWVLEDGKPLRAWDTEAFIERALKSRGGVVIIGDSVTVQMLFGLENLLGAHHGEWPRTIAQDTKADEKGMYLRTSTLTLQPENPLFKKLLEKPSLASVPRERFSRPFVTSYRSDVLMNEVALNITMTNAGMTETLNPIHHISTGDWRQGLWNTSQHPGWPEELDTIVVLNTGPHWTTWPLMPATDEHVIKGYTATMAGVYEFFAAPPPMPITSFFRATSAAHKNCNAHSRPVPANSTTASDPAPSGDKYGWHLFSTFNHIAQEFFASPKMRYLDIWSMSAQRPDGHSGWQNDDFDCLHWCHPSVPEWWSRILWHTIEEEGL